MIAKLWRHMRMLWPRWTLLPPLPFILWAIFWAIRGELRWEHVGLAVAPVVLAYTHRFTKRLYLGLLPMGLVAVFYDGMRFVKNAGLTEATVHNCDLRAAEATLFGFGLTVNGQPATLHDWFQAHATTALDLFCAIPYGTFIFAVMAYAVFLYVRDFSAQQRFTWAFLLLNIAGFATYHIYPAAPPWYYHANGCHVDLAAAASPGPNLLRVDHLLGISYFQAFYGRASDVFGAVPSLHVTYPLLMLVEGWRHHKLLGRALLVLFFSSMCFAAVYLDHHWVIDVAIGAIYGISAALAMRAAWSWAERKGEILSLEAPSKEPTI
jgi:inositol phosphorylceramide synthase catalytic subunit